MNNSVRPTYKPNKEAFENLEILRRAYPIKVGPSMTQIINFALRQAVHIWKQEQEHGKQQKPRS